MIIGCLNVEFEVNIVDINELVNAIGFHETANFLCGCKLQNFMLVFQYLVLNH